MILCLSVCVGMFDLFVPCGTTWSRARGSLSFKNAEVQWTTALYLSAHYPYTDLLIDF